MLAGPYVHNIDPIIGSIAGVHLWWYGLSYSLGFLNVNRALFRSRGETALTVSEVWSLTLFVTFGVLLGGRFVEAMFYEWWFYKAHPALVPAYWLGGMATHGLLIGAIGAIALFSRFHKKSFLQLTDAVSIAAAFILGMGRIGNFFDGQIVGSVTSVPWAVKFPDAEGFRHPVVLYDGLKNFLIIPVMIWAARQRRAPGFMTGLFLFLYAFLRIFVDLFREYPTTLLGVATGQALNIAFSLTGVALIVWRRKRIDAVPAKVLSSETQETPHLPLPQIIVFAVLLIFSLSIPSDSTQDIPARYNKRHAGLQYNALYPRLPEIEPHGIGTKSQLQ